MERILFNSFFTFKLMNELYSKCSNHINTTIYIENNVFEIYSSLFHKNKLMSNVNEVFI